MMEENRSPARRFAKGDGGHRASEATQSGGLFSSTEGLTVLTKGIDVRAVSQIGPPDWQANDIAEAIRAQRPGGLSRAGRAG